MNELRECLASHSGPVLFLIVFAEQIGLPIPAAPILMAAGALAASGTLSPAMIMLMTIAASLVADVIWYYLGWRGGTRALEVFLRLFGYDRSSLQRAERMFAQHAVLLVITAKFLPWLGNLIPPLAGTFRMGLGKFLRFDLLSSVLYGGVYVGVGIIFSAEVNTALEMLSEISSGKIALVVALVLILWTAKARSRQKSVAAASAV